MARDSQQRQAFGIEQDGEEVLDGDELRGIFACVEWVPP